MNLKINSEDRVNRIRKHLSEKKLDAVIVSSIPNILYLTDFSSFSGDEREAYVLITKDKSYIFTSALYAEAVRKTVPDFELIETLRYLPAEKIFPGLIKKHKLENVAVEENNITAAEYKKFNKLFKQIFDLNIREHRAIKTNDEINLIKKACQITDSAFDFILKEIKPKASEKEIAKKIEIFFKQNSGDVAFDTIVAFGPNNSVPHHKSGDSILGEKDSGFVLIDFGAKYGNFCSDCTRTVFWGKPNKKQKQIYQTVLEAQQNSINFLSERLNKKQKIKTKDVDHVARGYIKSQGFPNMIHSLGHGVGLEIHEHPYLSPKSKEYLDEGMVFSIEPGIYIPDFGGVRIEDLFAIHNGRLIQLTKSSHDLIIV